MANSAKKINPSMQPKPKITKTIRKMPKVPINLILPILRKSSPRQRRQKLDVHLDVSIFSQVYESHQVIKWSSGEDGYRTHKD